MTNARPSLDDLRIERDERPASRGRALIGLAVLVAAAAALFAWAWLNRADVPTVRAEAAREGRPAGASAGTVLNASGYVTARRRATVSSKVTGKVVEVNVEEGMAVRQGQVLARLDDSLARAALGLAEAQLASTMKTDKEIEARLREARLSLDRARTLVAQGVAAQSDLDSAEAEVASLEARLAVVRQDVFVAERQVDLQRTELEDLTIRAPFSGVALSKDAQPGEMVSPISAGGGFTRTGISTIVDMSSLEIEVDVNEAYINRVAPRQRVEAVLDAYPDWKIPAHVITIVPTADRQKATVLVRIGFDALDPRILPDMGVKVAFLEEPEAQPEDDAARPRLLIPKAALRTSEGRSVVLVLARDRVERRAVSVGEARGDEVEVVAGLTAGERVVVEGPAELRDGTRVRIAP